MGSSISGFSGQIGLLSLLKPGMSLIFGRITMSLFSLMGMLFGSPYSVTMVAYSDASGTGCGGYVVELGPEVSHCLWSALHGENLGRWIMFYALLLLIIKLKGHTVKWLIVSDNQNVVQIIQYGSKKPHLQDGAMSIQLF